MASTTAVTKFMPGFLDNLGRDEKIIVLSAIAILIIFVGAIIGGIICVLTGTGRRDPYDSSGGDDGGDDVEFYNPQTSSYLKQWNKSYKNQQASEYVISLRNVYIGDYGEGGIQSQESVAGRLPRNTTGEGGIQSQESVAGRLPRNSTKRTSRFSKLSQTARTNITNSSRRFHKNRRKRDRKYYTDGKRFKIMKGRPSSAAGTGKRSNSKDDLGRQLVGYQTSPSWPYSYSNLSEYVPKATRNGLMKQ